MNLQYPQINGKTGPEQLAQIRGFLFQLVEQLNMEGRESSSANHMVGGASDRASIYAGVQGTNNGAGTPMSTFNQIKSLIIKSADIIDAYYEEINRRLESVYVAESEFGTYTKQASQNIQANADGIKQNFDSIQSISGQLDQAIRTRANIRSGLLFTVGDDNLEAELGQSLPEGSEVYGVEIGQTTAVDGKEVFNKFARFTAYGMTLYDNNGNLTAYITDSRLNIPNADIKNSLTRGGFVETINSDGSSVERWVGV